MVNLIKDVNLRDYSYIFETQEINDFKRINFVYGQNGTGKSTLTKALKSQYASSYDIHIFQGFRKLIGENKYLNSITLGRENVTVQKRIDELNIQINEIRREIQEPEEGQENLYTELQKYLNKLSSLESMRERDFSKIAKEIKNNHLGIVGPNYNKRYVKEEIKKGKNIPLSQEEIRKYKKTLENKLKKITKQCPCLVKNVVNCQQLEKSVADIATKELDRPTILPELNSSQAKEDFAYQGMKIHTEKVGEVCAFCGNTISPERWEKLKRYFSDSVGSIQEEIKAEKIKINNYITKIHGLSLQKDDYWYENYEEEYDRVLGEIENRKKEIIVFLEKLRSVLQEKEQSPFATQKMPILEAPEDFAVLNRTLEELWEKNWEYGNNLNKFQRDARNKLKSFYIWQEFNKLNMGDILTKIELVKRDLGRLQDERKEKEDKLKALEAEKKGELAKTKNEEEAAIHINELLGRLGTTSFRLKLKYDERQKGLYSILGYDGNERDIATLSTGEKNLLAFLWFVYKLDDLGSTRENSGEQVIIIDDPVNSNDSNSQFLVISIIQDLMSNEDKQLFIFTHNAYFFKQVDNKFDRSKKSYYKLQKVQKTKVLTIKNEKALSSSYEELWEEFYMFYAEDEPRLMWNSARRIIDAFSSFNYFASSPKELQEKFPNKEEKILYLALLKGLN